jgi:hypothetical protein
VVGELLGVDGAGGIRLLEPVEYLLDQPVDVGDLRVALVDSFSITRLSSAMSALMPAISAACTAIASLACALGALGASPAIIDSKIIG